MLTQLESLSERTRAVFARELHDDIGGLLVSALMDITGAEAELTADATSSRQKLTRARECLTAAVERGRGLTDALRPTLLDEVGLFAALRWHTRCVSARTAIPCILTLPPQEPKFIARCPIILFRIIEEGLARLLAHHSPSAAAVTVCAGRRELIVHLDSTGAFEVNAREEDRRFCTLRLKARVAALGGTLREHRPATGGAHLTARFPLKRCCSSPRRRQVQR